MDETCFLGILPTMDFDWKAKVMIAKFSEGTTYREAASAAGMTKQALQKRMATSPEFKEAVTQAREAGASERRYRAFLTHPNRGKRELWWKAGVVPAFRYGRR